MAAGRITLSHLAQKLGLSTATVSRALRDDDAVNLDTRSQVQRLATELGYTPRPSKDRTLPAVSSKLKGGFGLVHPLTSFAFEDPLMLDFVGGMASRAFELDRLFHMVPTEVSQEEMTYGDLLAQNVLDGFILLNARPSADWRIRYLLARNIPFVVHGRGNETMPYPCLDVGFRSGHRRAVQHLLSLGHRNIALLNSLPGTLAAAEWDAGYREGLEAAGVQGRANWVFSGPKTEEFGYRALRQLLESEPAPTAVVCSNVLSAKGAVQALSDLNLTVGRDFSLVAYDDQLPGAFYAMPITTIFAPCRPMGTMLADLLERAVSGESYAKLQRHVEPELVIRASTGSSLP